MVADARQLLPDLNAFLAGAERSPLATVGKSGARFERVLIDGLSYVIKHQDPAEDWLMRWAAVPGGSTARLWRRGIFDELPGCFEPPVVAVASDGVRSSVLMRDVGPWLVPTAEGAVPAEQEARFLDHMAALHARFWQTDLAVDIVSPRRRYLCLSPAMAGAELARGSGQIVPRLVADGWPRFERVAARAAGVIVPLLDDPGPLLAALGPTPQTLVHGDWKLDNLGSSPGGRTILLDWELSGLGAATSDLAWYLAINCRRLAGSKAAAIATYREALERYGIDTGPWWDTQLSLALVGALVQFGWEKALNGYDDELAWWEEQVVSAAPLLAR
jgi:hypothetical protein